MTLIYIYSIALLLAAICGIAFLVYRDRSPKLMRLDRPLAFVLMCVLFAPCCALAGSAVLNMITTTILPPASLNANDVTSKGYLGLLPNAGSKYSQLDHYWTQGEDSACLWLVTRFLDKDGNKVALLQEAPTCGTYFRNVRTDRPIPIKWANSSAIPCDPNPGLSRESSYRTCFTWSVGKTSFTIYANLSEDESVDFIDSFGPEGQQ